MPLVFIIFKLFFESERCIFKFPIMVLFTDRYVLFRLIDELYPFYTGRGESHLLRAVNLGDSDL